MSRSSELRRTSNELTQCGQSRHWIFRLRWRSICSQLRHLLRRIVAQVTDAAVQARRKSPNRNRLFAARWINAKGADSADVGLREANGRFGFAAIAAKCSIGANR